MNGENLTAKTPSGDFQVTTPKTSLLSQQAVTSKGIPSTLLTYSWTLTPIPNWTCSVVTVPFSNAQLPSTWLTNCADPSTWLQSPIKKIVGCKVLQFIHMMKIKKMFGHKTLRCTYTATSSRERDELGKELHLQLISVIFTWFLLFSYLLKFLFFLYFFWFDLIYIYIYLFICALKE